MILSPRNSLLNLAVMEVYGWEHGKWIRLFDNGANDSGGHQYSVVVDRLHLNSY